MRNLKKFLALFLALMMAFSLMVTVNAADEKFMDGVNDSFAEAVDVLNGMGVFTGYEDGTFGADKNISRAEVAAIVYRLATGDAGVEPKQAHLYVDGAAKFDDVPASHWAAGYIGYCANNQLVLGYDESHFGPSDNVTGVQALAMILRAVGYGQAGEFAGPAWATNVYGRARTENLLKNVDKTSYSAKLSLPATRELVAELLFQAAQIPTVTYTMLGSYNKYTTILGMDEKLNPSLGVKNFGLTSDTGIILGNQATGEDDTLIGFNSRTGVVADGDPNTNEFIKDALGNYTYASTATTNITVPFDYETGLKMFGHKVKVWYDNRANADGYTIDSGAVEQDANKTYTVIDKAELDAYVYAEDEHLSQAGGTVANTKLGAAASAAGFTVKVDSNGTGVTGANTTAATSDEYKRIDATKAKTTAAPTDVVKSPVNMYYLVSNNSAKTVDVVVTLSAEVAKITEVNSTAKDKYLTLGTDKGNESEFTNVSGKQQILLDNLTPDSVKKIGELVCAWEVRGTTDANPAEDAWLYQLDTIKTTTKQVSSFVAPTSTDEITLDTDAHPVVTKVNFTDGTSMSLSGITLGSGTESEIISLVLPIVANMTDADVATANSGDNARVINLKAGRDYVVYEDVLGRFISMTTGSDTTFIYATFGDFEMGALGSGDSRYTLTGVGPDGEKIENHPFIAMLDGGTMKPIVGNVDDTYNALPITKKDFGKGDTGNQIVDAANTGYMITADGQLYDYTGGKMANGDKWAVKTSDVNLGVARVKSAGVDYLLTEDTQFYVVEGSGTSSLKVTPYKGIRAFLGSNASREISYVDDIDEVVFWTAEDVYGTTATSKNHNVAKVILSDTNLKQWGAQTMYYSFNQEDATGLVLPGAGATVAQYELYADGVKGTYFIDTSLSAKKSTDGIAAGATWTATTDIETDTFYTLTEVRKVNGVPVYKAEGVYVGDNLSYNDGVNTKVTYNYVAVNNLNFAELEKAVKLIFSVGNAKIFDVEYEDGTLDAAASVKNARSKITTIEELNHAISVMQTAQDTAVYAVQVSVVYDTANVATIYITEVADK